jgi:hypothetical protein
MTNGSWTTVCLSQRLSPVHFSAVSSKIIFLASKGNEMKNGTLVSSSPDMVLFSIGAEDRYQKQRQRIPDDNRPSKHSHDLIIR